MRLACLLRVMLIGSMLQAMCRERLVVCEVTGVFVMKRSALFWAICSLYLFIGLRELRGTVGYIRAGRMVVLKIFSLLYWLRPENFFSFERRSSAVILCVVAWLM